MYVQNAVDSRLTNRTSAVFQAGGLVVVLVEVMRKAYLASIVPVIVNAVLNEHQVVVDIVAFVSKGDFPRSRLGEKQRGKILASWVTRKMRTIAQFGIRDADTADSQITEVAEPRSGVGSVVGKKSSLRNVESASGGSQLAHDYNTLPTGISEMPAEQYESSIVESPPIPTDEDRNDTPTDTQNANFPFAADDHLYPRQQPGESPQEIPLSSYPSHHPQQHDSESSPINTTNSSDFDFNPDTAPPQPRYESKPTLSSTGRDARPSQFRLQQQVPPVPPLPTSPAANSSTYDSGRSGSGGGGGARGGKLRITNADSDDEGEWPREALMHMNLGGERRGSGRGGGGGGGGGSSNGSGGGQEGWNAYDGRGYGNAI